MATKNRVLMPHLSMHRWCLLGVLLSLVLSSTVKASDATDLNELLAKRNRSTLPQPTVLKITGIFTEYGGLPEKAPIAVLIKYESIFTLGSNAKCNFKANFVRIRTDKPGEYVDRQMQSVYDGSKWMTYTSAYKQPDKWITNNEVVVENSRPMFLGDESENYITGEALIVDQLKLYDGITVKELLNKGDAFLREKHFRLVKEAEQYIIQMNDACMVTALTIDPVTLTPRTLTIKENLCNAHGKPIEITYQYAGSMIARTGLVVPAKITRSFSVGGDVHDYSVNVITAVEVLPDEDSQSNFQVTIPPGGWVYDKRFDIVIPTGLDRSNTLDRIRTLNPAP